MNRLFTVLGAVALGCSPGCGFFAQGVADAAATALIVGGKGEYAHLSEKQMTDAFGGYFAGYDTRVNVDFPGSNDFEQSVEVGTANLYRDVYATYATDPDGFITIGGVSEGAPSVTAVLQRLAQDLENPPPGIDVPDPEHLNAAVYGYPSKALRIGTDFEPFPETPYDLVFVFAEYDFIADFPDNPFNLLAVVNAAMGGEQLHVDGSNFPILTEPTEWVSVTNQLGGTTTTIMIPATVLPLLVPLQNAGASPEKIAKLDKLLRRKIDRAYRRPAMTSGVIPQDVLPWPPGYPAPALPVATPMAATAASARVVHAKVQASIASPPKDVVTDHSALPASVVLAERHKSIEQSAAGDEEQAGSADANTTGGRHRRQGRSGEDGSGAVASHPENAHTRARSSANVGATHSTARKFGRH